MTSLPHLARTTVLAILAVLLLATSAFAANPKPGKDEDPVASAGTEASAALLKVAAAEYAAGHFEKAAGLFLTCYEVDSKNLSCLFNAARSEQRSFQLDKAETHFQLYLEVNKTDETGRKRAQVHLEEIREVRAQLKKQQEKAAAGDKPVPEKASEPGKDASKETPPSVPTVVQPGPPREGAWKSTAGWVTAGVGVALVATAAVLFVRAGGDQKALDKDTAVKDDAGLITLSHDAYVRRQNAVNSQVHVADALLGVGIAAAAAGAWMWATAPSVPSASAAGAPTRPTFRASVAAGEAHVALTWRF